MKRVLLIVLLYFSSMCLAQISTEYGEIDESFIPFNFQVQQNNKIKQWFVNAENLYPQIPKGFLEGFAYTTTGWQHVDKQLQENHNEITFLGIMGLIANNKVGFRNTYLEVARNYGITPDEMLNNPELEILATADFVAQLMNKASMTDVFLEDMQPISEYLSGLPIPTTNKVGDIDSFAANSFFYDILLINQKGHDDDGILITSKNIDMQVVFPIEILAQQQASLVKLDIKNNKVLIDGYNFNSVSQKFSLKNQTKATVDFPTSRWNSSPNHSSRNGTRITHVSIHRMEGYYASSISLFKRRSAKASAHYMVRSSDGQVTQMVREYRNAWHTKNNNSYTIGIEHEGFSRNTSKLTTAMYNVSSRIVKSICSRRNINCNKTYKGPGNPLNRKDVKPKSLYTVKGHAHYPGGTHWDPGPHWDWNRFYTLINGTSGGGNASSFIMDSFESSEGHFDTKPSLSGSTRGISAWSSAQRTSQVKRKGSYSEQIKLIDNPNTSANWQVRFLSASGRPSSNKKMTVSGGRIGFWVMTGGSGMQVAVSIDDSDGTEKSDVKSIPAGTWTYVSWQLDKSTDWNTWVGGNGRLNASQVTLDAIWFLRNQTAYNVYIYIDDVKYTHN